MVLTCFLTIACCFCYPKLPLGERTAAYSLFLLDLLSGLVVVVVADAFLAECDAYPLPGVELSRGFNMFELGFLA